MKPYAAFELGVLICAMAFCGALVWWAVNRNANESSSQIAEMRGVPDLLIQGPDQCPKCNCQPTPPWEFSWEDAGGFRHEVCFDLDFVGREGPCDDLDDLGGSIVVWPLSRMVDEWIPPKPNQCCKVFDGNKVYLPDCQCYDLDTAH